MSGTSIIFNTYCCSEVISRFHSHVLRLKSVKDMVCFHVASLDGPPGLSPAHQNKERHRCRTPEGPKALASRVWTSPLALRSFESICSSWSSACKASKETGWACRVFIVHVCWCRSLCFMYFFVPPKGFDENNSSERFALGRRCHFTSTAKHV